MLPSFGSASRKREWFTNDGSDGGDIADCVPDIAIWVLLSFPGGETHSKRSFSTRLHLLPVLLLASGRQRGPAGTLWQAGRTRSEFNLTY